MSGSILLPITGTQESLCAIEFTWTLALKSSSSVNAQHVVNTRAARDFVGMERPGIIGSGPYVGAYETVCQALRDIAEKLTESYLARAQGRNVTGDVFIDEGNPLEEICKRAILHDLVVMGHRQRNTLTLSDRQAAVPSMAEVLAHYLDHPLLIVQKPVKQVSAFDIFASMDHINTNWLRKCIASANALGASTSLTFFATGENEEEPMNFVRDLKQSLPESKDMRIRLITRNGGRLYPAQICCHHMRRHSEEGSVLAVIPTIGKGDRRITTLGESPSALLRRLNFDAVLLWPEESSQPLFVQAPTSLAAVS